VKEPVAIEGAEMIWRIPIWLWGMLFVGIVGPVIIHLIWMLCFDRYIWNEEGVEEVLGEEFIERYQIK
jgi:hypothetical protein